MDKKRLPAASLYFIRQYVGDCLFRNVVVYERLASEIKYLEFSSDKITDTRTNYFAFDPLILRTFSMLTDGPNINVWINLQLLRIMNISNLVFCFVFDNIFNHRIDRFACLVIICKSQKAAKQWVNNNIFLDELYVSEPYRRVEKNFQISYFITRVENVKAQKPDQVEDDLEGVQKLKAEGNNKFKQKQYLEALIAYEKAIGLLTDFQKKRQRSVLYSNSSACLLEMKLYSSACFYAEAASQIDNTYSKAVYRRFQCLLELKRQTEVFGPLMNFKMLASKSEFNDANSKMIRYFSNKQGIFNWIEFLRSPNLSFGEYISQKLTLSYSRDQSNRDKNARFYANDNIKKYEMLIVEKPFYYSEGDLKSFYNDAEKKVNVMKKLLPLDRKYYETFATLPVGLDRLKSERLKYVKENDFSLSIDQIRDRMIYCNLHSDEGTNKKSYFAQFKQLCNFGHCCLSNCSHLTLKGTAIVYALRNIKKGELLTIDFVDTHNGNRKQYMKAKIGWTCDCQFCQEVHEYETKYDSLIDCVARARQLINWQSKAPIKIRIFAIYRVFIHSDYLINSQIPWYHECMKLIEEQPIWDCVIGGLKILKVDQPLYVREVVQSTILKIIRSIFKISESQSMEMLRLYIEERI